MGYISRYIREHYVRRNIRRDLYERLVRWCGERSVNSCLEKALSILEANIGANIAPNTATVISANKPVTLAPNIAPNIGANIAPNTGASQPKPSTVAGKGYEWCRPRSSIKNLEGFIKYVERTYGLEDWWEEGEDMICFKTARPPQI
jgi:hypothetical protein